MTGGHRLPEPGQRGSSLALGHSAVLLPLQTALKIQVLPSTPRAELLRGAPPPPGATTHHTFPRSNSSSQSSMTVAMRASLLS